MPLHALTQYATAQDDVARRSLWHPAKQVQVALLHKFSPEIAADMHEPGAAVSIWEVKVDATGLVLCLWA